MGATPAGYSTTGGSDFFHFPRRQRLDRTLAGARARAGRDSGQGYPRPRHCALRLRGARPARQRSAHPAEQPRGARAQRRQGRRDRLYARLWRRHGPSRAREGLRARELEHDDPLSGAGDAGGAEDGAARPRQMPADLYERGAAQLGSVPQAWGSPGAVAGLLLRQFRVSADGQYRVVQGLAVAGPADHAAHGARAGAPRPQRGRPEPGGARRAARNLVRDLRAQRPRPSSAAPWARPGSIPRATSKASR